MLIIKGTTQFHMEEPTAVVLGKFDGVHLGHQFLIEKLMQQKEKGLKTVVFTFDQSPSSLFSKEDSVYRELCTLEEKRLHFDEMGVDVLIEFPMNQETSKISAEDFIQTVLHKQLHCKCLIAGDDVRFGHKGLGNAEMLKAYQGDLGYAVDIYSKVTVESIFEKEMQDTNFLASNDEISSTLIRDKVGEGNIDVANFLMGHAFQATGTVKRGLSLAGSKLQMPTANISWPEAKVIPAFGVYFTLVKVGDKTFRAITNVGKKPTVTDTDETNILAETYLYDFAGDLYEQEITIYFYHFLRKEEKFSNIEELKKQLSMDRVMGQNYWEAR